MLRRPATFIALGLVLLAASDGALGAGKTLNCYKPQFFLERVDFPSAPVWIAEGEPIVDTRLLPSELWEVTEPVVRDGAVLLQPGDQLMSMKSAVPIRCNFPQIRGRASGSPERVCVLDPDKDGQFDQILTRSRGGDYWFGMSWEHPKETQAISPAAMTQKPPSEFKGGPRLKVYADHIPLRTHPRDGAAPYYEAFVRVKLYGSDGLSWFLCLSRGSECPGYVKDDVAYVSSMSFRFDDVDQERTLISYVSNFSDEIQNLPFLNSYERRCDTYTPRIS